MESISGLLADDIMGKNLLKDIPFHTLDGEAGFRQLFLNTKCALVSTSCENMPIITPKGYLSYQTVSLLPLLDSKGVYDGMAVYVEELSDDCRKEKSFLDELQYARQMDFIYENIPVIFFRWSVKEGWPVEFVSDNISQLGYKKDDFISGSALFADIIHPDDLKSVRKHKKKCEAGILRYLFDGYRILNKEGISVWVNEISVLRLDNDGDPSYYEGMIIDVTGKVKAESSLTREFEYLNDVTSSLEVGICIISPQYQTIWANDYQKKIFGAVEGKLCYNAYNKKSNVCENCAVQRILETGKSKVVTDQSSFDVDGNPIWSHIIASPVYDGDGNVVSVMEVVFPITDMKMVEMELRESKARLESVLKTTPVGMGVVSNHIFEEVNDRLCEMLGYSREELIGQSLRMICPNDEVYEYVSREKNSMIMELGIGEVETKVLCKDGNIIDVILSSSPIYPDFVSKGVTFTVLDITKLKDAERELKEYSMELERLNDLKDLFSDIIHHDLLNPAGLVRSYAEILEDMEKDDVKLQFLGKLNENNTRVIELIESASKYEKLKFVDDMDFHNADLVAIFRGVMDDLDSPIINKGMKVVVSSKGPCFSKVNPFIREVFFNLLSNAIKYSDENKRIDVEFLDGGSFWEVRIIDRGEGISDQNKGLIFDRFKRADKKGVKGTGIGLAIVKRIMELHDGEYGVEDNPEGKGSVFWVSIKKEVSDLV